MIDETRQARIAFWRAVTQHIMTVYPFEAPRNDIEVEREMRDTGQEINVIAVKIQTVSLSRRPCQLSEDRRSIARSYRSRQPVR